MKFVMHLKLPIKSSRDDSSFYHNHVHLIYRQKDGEEVKLEETALGCNEDNYGNNSPRTKVSVKCVDLIHFNRFQVAEFERFPEGFELGRDPSGRKSGEGGGRRRTGQ